MRTLIILAGGLLLWALCVAVARFSAGHDPAAMTVATWVFLALWLLLAIANLWLGVASAGYTLREELPIFLLIFLLPAAVAVLARWKFL
jgi:hypothetical protein